ncbi:MAG: energy-coupled thiamine transporter ThiT [Gemmatimonadota bacterium]
MRSSPPDPRTVAELAVAVALAAVLSLVRIRMPHLLYGGSVSLQALPLLAVALRRGTRAGMVGGAAYGFVDFLIGPYYVHPIQVLLDYPVAFGALGLAALPARARWLSPGAAATLGVILASAARLTAHFLSGIVYFADLAPEGVAAWKYSLGYNASYVVPEAAISLVLIGPLLRRLRADQSSGARRA